MVNPKFNMYPSGKILNTPIKMIRIAKKHNTYSFSNNFIESQLHKIHTGIKRHDNTTKNKLIPSIPKKIP